MCLSVASGVIPKVTYFSSGMERIFLKRGSRLVTFDQGRQDWGNEFFENVSNFVKFWRQNKS